MAKVARRHYRVAKKEVVLNPEKGMFIPKNRKPYLILAVVGVWTLAFINGIMAGLMIGRRRYY